MTETLDRIREAVKVLPAVEERQEDGTTVFLVEGDAFARVADTATVRGDDGWVALPDGDPTAIDDAVAHAWELTAPRGLLEAGGR